MPRSALVFSTLAMLLASVAGSAAGQGPPGPGSTVRVTLRGASVPVVGRLSATDSTAWVIDSFTGERRRAPLSDVVGVELQVRERKTAKGALIGTAGGLAIGLLATSGRKGDPFQSAANAATILGTMAGGALVGAVIGSSRMSPRWVPSAYPLTRSDGLGLAWRIPLAR